MLVKSGRWTWEKYVATVVADDARREKWLRISIDTPKMCSCSFCSFDRELANKAGSRRDREMKRKTFDWLAHAAREDGGW